MDSSSKLSQLLTVTRDRGRWISGLAGFYDVTNRTGEGSRPGREDYALVMAHAEAADEPLLDWSNAHLSHFDPVARIDRDSPRRFQETVYRGSPEAAPPTLTRVL